MQDPNPQNNQTQQTFSDKKVQENNQTMIAYSPSFINLVLPQGHRFPMSKYAALAAHLLEQGWDIKPAPRAQRNDLEHVHTPTYIDTWFHGTLSPKEQRVLGFPQSPELLERSLHSVGGTLAAMRQAFDRGYGINLAGGTHHAFADRGEGFCVFNDLAIAARHALDHGLAKRILIVDLDVHQGNGTADIFKNEPNVFTFSIHGERNYPFHKETSDCDLGLPDGTGDEQYLEVMSLHLPNLFEDFKPDLVFLQAGTDVLANDRFGRMNLSPAGVVARDSLVYTLCQTQAIPMVYTMGGGYQTDVAVTVAAHAASLTALKLTF
jgi:acetoin utilization deacetylase AcuC-like enzyme